VRAVPARGLAPARRRVVARRRFPVEAPAGQGGENELRVKEHPHRCEQQRMGEFDDGAADEPARAAEAVRLAATDDRDERQDLGREQQHRGQPEQREHQLQVGRRPDREELVRLEEVGRIDARCRVNRIVDSSRNASQSGDDA
jgi:hypothetical protein